MTALRAELAERTAARDTLIDNQHRDGNKIMDLNSKLAALTTEHNLMRDSHSRLIAACEAVVSFFFSQGYPAPCHYSLTECRDAAAAGRALFPAPAPKPVPLDYGEAIALVEGVLSHENLRPDSSSHAMADLRSLRDRLVAAVPTPSTLINP